MGGFAGLLFIASLAIAQTGDGELTRLPPVDEYSYFDLGAPADEADLGIVAEMDGMISLPGTFLTSSWLVGGGFGTFDLEASHTWLMGYDDWPPVTISPGLGIHYWSGPAGIDLPPRVYDVYFDLQWRPIDSESWGLSIGIVPGWYGDFATLDGHTFQLTGWILGNYRLNERWNLVGGVAYVRQLRSTFLPVGGVIWTPSETTRLELLIPKPKVAHRVSNSDTGSTWLYVAGQLGGGTWAVADTTDLNVSVSYTDLRLVLGLETFRAGGVEGSLEAGYVFAREISVDSFVVFSPQDTFLLQATLAF